MTFREIIQIAGELRPHSYSEQTVYRWVIALDGKLAAAVFLMAPAEFKQRNYSYPKGLDNEPLVDYPHQEMYVQYLLAQIDLALGESEQYQNDMAVYNESYTSFVKWFTTMYAPGRGYGSGCRCGCGPDGNPPYYLTAYALAVQQGFQGTLEEWLRSLHGDSVELRVEGAVLQYRQVPQVGTPEDKWVDLFSLYLPDVDVTQLQGKVLSLEQAVADLRYVPIAFESIRNSSPVNELGQTIVGVELFWATNKMPVSTLLDGVSVANDPEWADTDNNSYAADKTWSVIVSDERGATASATTTAKFYNGIYYGAAAKPLNDEDEVFIDSAFILSLEKKLQGSRKLTFTVDAIDVDDFVWFCVPVAYGECTFSVGGFDGGFTLVDTLAFTNAHGYTENYRIYRSDYGGLGETTVEVR